MSAPVSGGRGGSGAGGSVRSEGGGGGGSSNSKTSVSSGGAAADGDGGGGDSSGSDALAALRVPSGTFTRSPSKMSEVNLRDVFDEQQRYVNYFFAQLDHGDVQRFVDIVLACTGVVFLSGTGKSGLVARNISQMMVSVGIRAMYLNPTDALHGDVGVVHRDDVVVLFSKSGESIELLQVVPAARNKGARLVAVTSNVRSSLNTACDVGVHLPLEAEACPFDLAPITSSIIQLIFGNTVVAALMRRTNLSKEDYALNHPAGRIGKRLTLRVDDVMRPVADLGLCTPDQILIDLLPTMSAKRCGCLVIVKALPDTTTTTTTTTTDELRLVGIFTDGDLRRAIETGGSDVLQQPINSVMTITASTVRAGTLAFDAMQEMERSDPQRRKKRVKELPVVDECGCVCGLLTLHDLVQCGL
mmetsp:Transcript_14286/g.35390  ORF Transcript_14286/g.35390 Transcript_14286/m.35390 type:complete len:415 (+) Transcript_14286:134-1378(+)